MAAGEAASKQRDKGARIYDLGLDPLERRFSPVLKDLTVPTAEPVAAEARQLLGH